MNFLFNIKSLNNIKLFIFGYLVSILLFLIIYGQNISDAYRGEMWELLFIYASNLSLTETINLVSSFACFGAGRFQPLAFFVPYFQVVLGGVSYSLSHFFTLILHILCAMIVSNLCYRWTKNYFISLIAFLLIIFSFLASDVLIWTFFSYVQVHSILILLSISAYITYLYSNKISSLILSWIAALLSCLMYESGIVAILIQPFFVLIFRQCISKKILLLEIALPIILFSVYMNIAYLAMSLDYRDSNTTVHYMIFIKPVSYFIYYLRYNFGLNASADIYNIASIYGLEINYSLFNLLIIIFLVFIIIIFICLIKQNIIKYKISNSPEIWFIFFILLSYVLLMSFARVPEGANLFETTGLESQFRYYYTPNLLFILLFSIILGKAKIEKYMLIIICCFTSLSIFGNIRNILIYGANISRATAPLSAHSLINRLNVAGDYIDDKDFIRKMHKDWYTENISTPRIYHAFTFNANTCLVHPELIKKKSYNQKFINVNLLGLPIDQKDIFNIKLVDMSQFSIISNSQLPGAGPKEASIIGGGHLWHVKHIPSPPQVVWAEIDFTENNKKAITVIGFKPREGKADQFWDELLIQASDNQNVWNDLAEVQLGYPPNDADWININFNNKIEYRYYRLVIKGGFSLGRFMSLEGLNFYIDSNINNK